MCIDKLDIYIEGNTLHAGEGVTHYHDAVAAIISVIPSAAGSYTEGPIGRSETPTRFKFSLRGRDGLPDALVIYGRSYNGLDAWVTKIIANPYRLGSYGEFKRLMSVLAAHSDADFYAAAHIKRIDYACDYQLPITEIARGFYYRYSQTIIGYADVSAPYVAYTQSGGLFGSFRIGQGHRALKLYDKRAEEMAKVERARNRSRREHIRTGSGEWRDPFPAPSEKERTRLELSLTERGYIIDRWESGRDGDVPYTGTLDDLDGHLQDIVEGRFQPFSGILLNHLHTRTCKEKGFTFGGKHSDLYLRWVAENGLLNTAIRRLEAMGQDFWMAHRTAFAIFPMRQRFQPTSVFIERLKAWKAGERRFSYEGKRLPSLKTRVEPERLMLGPWPMEKSRPLEMETRSAAMVADTRLQDKDAA